MARNWAFKLERMSVDQRRLAEKFINEILFEGEVGSLHRHSVIINPSQANPSWSHRQHSPALIPHTPSLIQNILQPSHTPSTEYGTLWNTQQSVSGQIPSPSTQTNGSTVKIEKVETTAKF